MQTQHKRNSQFMIAKEVFIDHIQAQIQQHYELNQECLGEGGFGRVFEGRKKKILFPTNTNDPLSESFSTLETASRSCSDSSLNSQPRAIKRIIYKQPSDRQLMRNEMQILSYLDHPLIVKLYQTFEHKKHLYLVIDLLKGGDLFTVIEQRQKLPEHQAKLIFLQLVKALKYLHSQHICHRDLKLENVMFLDRHNLGIKLVDFGLAFCWDEDMPKELRQKGLHNKMTGTVHLSITQPDYMAPEMLAKNYDQRCDIWSAGVILYMLLSGQAPFQGSTQKDIVHNIKNINYTFDIPEFDQVTDSAKDLIRKILKPQNLRISLDEMLEHPWLRGDESKDCSQIETCSTQSVTSDKTMKKKRTELRQKSKTTKQSEKHLRKGSMNFSQDFENETSCKSYCSEDLSHESCPQKLTVAKLEHYSRMSKLQKFQAIFSVSKLSEICTKTYGDEFLVIDKDSDGTVSLSDLTQYLEETEGYKDKEQTQSYFEQVALSQRGYISYSEYLACVLAYHGDYFGENHSDMFEFDEKFSENGKSSDFSEDDSVIEPIDLFDDSMLEEMFMMLDKNADGQVTKLDFINLLKNNGIEHQNADFIKELTAKLSEVTQTQDKTYEKKQSKEAWFIDPRTYKDQLSRTYKGQSDGGMRVDWRGFRHLMRGSQACRQ